MRAAKKSHASQPENERRHHQLKLRLPPETIARVRALAHARGTTISSFVAELIDEASKRARQK